MMVGPVLGLLVMLLAWLPAGSGRLRGALASGAHFLLFCGWGWACSRALLNRRFSRRLTVLATAVVTLALLALERWVNVGYAWTSFFISWAGAWAGVCLARAWQQDPTWRRTVALGVAAVLALCSALPAALVLADRAQARFSHPELASFEGRSELGRWWAHHARLSRVTSHATNGRHALRVVLFKSHGKYPGLFMTDGPRDWGDASRLCFDVYLAGNAERSIWVRVDDRVDYPPYDDRAQTLLNLVPGHNSVCLDLESFLRTPAGRVIDRHDIHRWGLFFDDAQGGETFFLDHIRLTR